MARRKKRRRGNKKNSQMAHASRRAHQRYDFDLTEEVHDELVKMLHEGRTTPVEQQSLRVSVHEVEYEGKKLRFAYDKHRKQIVTFLYEDPAKYLEEPRPDSDT